MKKTVCCVLAILFFLVGCDRSHLWSLDILCSNENASFVVDDEEVDLFNFSSDELNYQPLESYSNIDFTNSENNSSNVKIYKFGITSSANDTYNLSLNLIDTNKYVVDFLRVGIIVDGEIYVYKYYDEHEELYHKENDPDTILHFNSNSEIFTDLAVDFSVGEVKEIVIFVWLEESELYDENGERYTGRADKSYNASPIMLSLEVK